jgi:hypothetical protein
MSAFATARRPPACRQGCSHAPASRMTPITTRRRVEDRINAGANLPCPAWALQSELLITTTNGASRYPVVGQIWPSMSCHRPSRGSGWC